MPVTAALLVEGGRGEGVRMPSSQAQPFNRQEKLTSSVRLRKRRDDVTAPGRRKNQRHSGDFSYFPPSERRKEEEGERSDFEGDWNYITFPNGVPNVKEIHTEGQSNRHVAPGSGQSPTNRGLAAPIVMLRPQGSSPVKLRTNLTNCRPMSSSVLNVRESPPGAGGHPRKSGDFSSQYRMEEEWEEARNRVHHGSRSQSHGPGVQPPSSQSSRTPSRPVVAKESRSRREGNTKRASAEFEFKKINRRSAGDFNHLSQVLSQELGAEEEKSLMERMISRELGGTEDRCSEGSEESGIFSTGSSQDSPRKEGDSRIRPGLGRRAVTQINIRDRKNSYSSALARSQENLVKVSSDQVESEEIFVPECPSIKKGLLWQQRDKLFSRWKERYFILTKDLLQCFKKGSSKITEMGEFILKIKLSEVDSIELLDKRGYLTICLILSREGKVFLRRTEGIREWYDAIKEKMEESKSRKVNRTSAVFCERRQNTEGSSIEQSLVQRKLRLRPGLSDSSPEVNKTGAACKERITLDELSNLYKNEELEEEEEEERKREVDSTKMIKKINRLSLMTDLELPDRKGTELGLDLEKGIYLRRNRGDTDSGNNSLHSSSTDTGSSKLSQPMESSFLEEDEEDYTEQHINMSPEIRIKKPTVNKNIIEVRYRERSSGDVARRVSTAGAATVHESGGGGQQHRRRSEHVNRLQITHV